MAAKATKKSSAALEKLRADIKSGSPENVYIFYGEETYLRDRYLEELKALRRSQRVFLPEGTQADCDRNYRLWKRAVSRAADWIEH